MQKNVKRFINDNFIGIVAVNYQPEKYISSYLGTKNANEILFESGIRMIRNTAAMRHVIE